jgi:hypothetical protein
MKANKALKRLARIEALMTDVTKRYSANPPHVREALDDAKAAVTRAKDAVRLQASSKTATNSPLKQPKPPSKATPEPSKPKRRISEEGMKRIIAANKKRSALRRAEAAKAQGAAKKVAATRKKTAVNKSAAKAPSKMAAKKAPRKVAVKKAAPKEHVPAKTAKAPVKKVVKKVAVKTASRKVKKIPATVVKERPARKAENAVKGSEQAVQVPEKLAPAHDWATGDESVGVSDMPGPAGSNG